MAELSPSCQDAPPLEARRSTQQPPLLPQQSSKQCRICGAVAINCNFGVVSCESCKAFFRRNAHKKSVMGQCKKGCHVTKETRTDCKCCRLQKCFIEGMDPALILSDEQLRERRRKISRNKKCKETSPDESLNDSTEQQDSCSLTGLEQNKSLTFQEAFIRSCSQDLDDDQLHIKIRKRLKQRCFTNLNKRQSTPADLPEVLSPVNTTLKQEDNTTVVNHAVAVCDKSLPIVCDNMLKERASVEGTEPVTANGIQPANEYEPASQHLNRVPSGDASSEESVSEGSSGSQVMSEIVLKLIPHKPSAYYNRNYSAVCEQANDGDDMDVLTNQEMITSFCSDESLGYCVQEVTGTQEAMLTGPPNGRLSVADTQVHTWRLKKLSKITVDADVNTWDIPVELKRDKVNGLPHSSSAEQVPVTTGNGTDCILGPERTVSHSEAPPTQLMDIEADDSGISTSMEDLTNTSSVPESHSTLAVPNTKSRLDSEYLSLMPSPYQLPFASCITTDVLQSMESSLHREILSNLERACSGALDKPMSGTFISKPNIIQSFNQGAGFVPIFVSFAKRLEGFKKLPLQTQIKLVKSSFVLNSGLYFLTRFDFSSQTFYMTMRSENSNEITEGRTNPDYIIQITNFNDLYHMAKIRLKHDTVIVLLIMCFHLFSAGDALCEQYPEIAYWSWTYLQILARYLSVKYPNGEVQMTDIYDFIAGIKQAESHFMKLVGSTEMSLLDPMLQEIYG